MTDLRQAAEMALEAMQDIIHWYSERDENDDVLPPYNQTPEILEAIQAVEALRQALAEPDTGTDRGAWSGVPDATKWVDELRGGDEELEEPPKREWKGLTDEEIKEIVGPWGETPIKGYTRKLFDQIETKLREKNT